MDKDVLMWILGGFAVCVSGGAVAYVSLSNRLTALETIIKMVNKQAAEILHSPHTPEFDVLLEKLVKTYEDRHYELSIEEWKQLQSMAQHDKEDAELPKGTRLLAAMVYAQCCHKLSVISKL